MVINYMTIGIVSRWLRTWMAKSIIIPLETKTGCSSPEPSANIVHPALL